MGEIRPIPPLSLARALVSNRRVGEGHTHLSTWVSGDVKRRLSAVAACQGISESALLRRLVEQMLASSGLEVSVPTVATSDTRAARLTIRLIPDDRLLLRERAAA